ncbi:ATP-binding protein [Alicyclobacillus dauci]|uniref:histidine kinase n=1 Tax=Alicyclobacillus dauci TaxID=1475485 RepID=A0ABY6Z245_9BACL|nr:ATP-binding protein [Alicyclobacillus dauci]WAH36757.1 ATP-binding protein [Alicyclobacillus dauci]
MLIVKRGYLSFLFASGIVTLIIAAATITTHHATQLVVVSGLAVVLSLLPIYLPGGLVWGTGVISYLFVLSQSGLFSSFAPLVLGTITVFSKHYNWDFRRVKWFRLFVTLGMYTYSLVGSLALERVVRNLPVYFHMLAMITAFEALNLLFFLGVQWSSGQVQSISRSFKTFHFIPLIASATILTLIVEAKYVIPSACYACILLLCFILLSRQYFRAVASSTEAENKYRLIARNTTDLIIVIDEHANITYASPSHENTFGCTSADLEGTSLYTYVDEQTLLQSLLGEISDNPVAQRVQFTFTVNHHSVIVETELSPVLNKQGKIQDIIVVSRDITDRIRQQEYIIQTEKLAVTGQLAAGIAHEIRNPLTAVKGFVQLLKGDFDDMSPESFNVLWTELCRIDEITSGLLMLAKPERAEYCTDDIGVLIHHTVTLLEGQAHEKNVYFEAPSFDPLYVYCNSNQMRQVFLNIFKNSIESMEHGGTIHVGLKSIGERAVIEITDEGTGIPEELIPSLGQPFYTTKEKGTGLGLMVVYNIIKEHGGTIHITSKKNVGTTVTLSLPAVEITKSGSPDNEPVNHFV